MSKRNDYATTVTKYYDFIKEEIRDGKTSITRRCKLCQREYRGYQKLNTNFIIHLKYKHKDELDGFRKETPHCLVSPYEAALNSLVNKPEIDVSFDSSINSRPRRNPVPFPAPLILPVPKVKKVQLPCQPAPIPKVKKDQFPCQPTAIPKVKKDQFPCQPTPMPKVKKVQLPSQPPLQTRQVKAEYSYEAIALKRKILKFEKLLIASGISLDIVNTVELKEFISELDPHFHIPHTETLKWDFNRHFESVERSIKTMLKEATIIITSLDLWVTKSMVTYLSVNAHFVTNSWNYEHKLLTMKRIFGIPNESTIIYEYEFILQKFDINKIVFLNLASNVTNLLKAFQLKFPNVESASGEIELSLCDLTSCVDDYDEFLDVNNLVNIETCKINGIINLNECFVHTLLFIIKESIHTVPALNQTLQVCGEILSHIRQSELSNEELKQLLEHCLQARQISAIHMFQAFFAVYDKMRAILLQNGQECWLLNQTQVEILKEFIEVLQPFHEAIDFVFNDFPASVSKRLPTTIALGRHLHLLNPIYLEPLIQTLIISLEQRFHGIFDDPIHVISTILHPAWKMTPFTNFETQLKARQLIIDELRKISDIIGTDENPSPEEVFMKDADPSVKKSRLSLMFQDFKSNNRSLSPYEIELDAYIKDDTIDEDANPLIYWQLNEGKYPHLSTLSRTYLAIPAMSMPIKRIRNLTDDIIKDQTNLTTSDLFSKTSVLKYNLDLF